MILIVASSRVHMSHLNVLTIKLNVFLANDPEFDLEAALDDFVTFFGAGQEHTSHYNGVHADGMWKET